MKKINKISLLSIPAITAFVPLATAISCGGSGVDYNAITKKDLAAQQKAEMDTKEADLAKTEVTIGIRNGEKDTFDAVAAEFNKLGRGKIKIVQAIGAGIDNLVTLYSTQATGGSMSDIFVGDTSVMKYILKNGVWAQPFDFHELTTNEKYDYKANSQDADDPKFSAPGKAALTSTTNGNDVSFAVPLGYGSRAIVLRQDAFKVGTTSVNAGDWVIDAWVPLPGGDAKRAWTSTPSGSTSTHFKSDAGEKLQHFLQRYINQSALPVSQTRPQGTDPAWLGSGHGSVFQRIYSIGRSFGAKLNANYITALKENFVNFGLFASAGVPGLYDTKTKTITQKNFEEKGFPNGHIAPKLADYLWNSLAGYVNGDTSDGNLKSFVAAYAANGDTNAIGELETLFQPTPKAAMSFNGLWSYDFIAGGMANAAATGAADGAAEKTAYEAAKAAYEADKTDANKKAMDDAKAKLDTALTNTVATNKKDKLLALSSPYADISATENWFMRKGLDAKKSVVAKRFIKFAMSGESVTIPGKTDPTTVGQAIAGPYVSSVEAIKTAQQSGYISNAGTLKNEATKANFFHAGQYQADATSHPNSWSTSGAYNGVEASVFLKTDGDYWRIWNDKLFNALGSTFSNKSNPAKYSFATKAEFTTKMDEIYASYKAEMSLA